MMEGMKPLFVGSIPVVALAVALMAAPSFSSIDCERCTRAQKDLKTRQSEWQSLVDLESANRAYLAKPQLAESVVSKIHSNLLIIDLKKKTADNFMQQAKKTLSESCSSCGTATSADSG